LTSTPEGDKISGRRIVFITGMHRSGTSFLARALNLAGLHIPQPDIGHDDWNQEGQWEATTLIQASLGLFGGVDRWFDPVVTNSGPEVLAVMRRALKGFCKEADIWSWKDPRLLITLPYWLRVLPPGWSPELVISLRNPMEIATSLKRRNRFDLSEGLRICDRYLAHARPYLDRPMPVHFFNFNAPDLENELTRISKSLGFKPNPQAWQNWYRPNLVTQKAGPAPAMRSYDCLFTRWRGQAGEAVQEPYSTPHSEVKPKLRLAILINNHIRQPEPSTWLVPCLDKLEANTSVYCDFKVFTKASQGLPDDLPHRLKLRLEVLPDDDTRAEVSPGGILQDLYDYASRRYEIGHLLIMHSDAWPIRPGWDVGLLAALEGPVRLVGLLSQPAGGAPYIDPAFMLLGAGCINRLSLRLDEPARSDVPFLSHITQKVLKTHGPKALLSLVQKSARTWHPEIGLVYGGMIYHHNACKTRPAQGPAHLETGGLDPDSLGAALIGKVFQEPHTYYEQLLYGDKAREYGLIRCLLAADPTSRQRERLWGMAREDLMTDPARSLYICGLLSRVYAYDPGFLEFYARVCARCGLSLDQAGLNRVKQFLMENPMGKKMATS
jgi:hypothetical protein